MAASLTTAAVNSVFMIVARCVEDQKTIDDLVNPNSSAGSPAGGTNADAWNYLREVSDFFSAAALGSHSINIVYADGGSTAQATNTVTFSGNPANNDTLTLQSVTITFVTGTPAGSQVKIGATQSATMANLVAFINAGGSAGGIAGVCSAAITTAGSIITLTVTAPGIIGNTVTLAKSSTALAVGAATFSGGAAVSQAGPFSAGI